MIRKFFAPPIYDDQKDNYSASLLNSILNILIPPLLLILFMQSLRLLFSGGQTEVYAQSRQILFLPTALLVVSIVCKYLNHNGRVRIASITFILVSMVATVFSINDGGIRDSSISFLIISIVIAGLLLNRWWVLVLTILATFSVGVIHIFHQIDLLPFTLPRIPLPGEFVPFLIAMLIIAAIQLLVVEQLKTEYSRAQANDEKLQQNSETIAQMQSRLEATAADHRKQLAQRDQYLQASAKIARESSSTSIPDQIMDQAVTLISEEFDYYHVGIFLIDDTYEWAILQAASSTAGKQLMQSGYQIRVGRQGIIGYVTSIGQPRVLRSIQDDLSQVVPKELPHTRSELALPLKVKDQIIGALDIHDRSANAFPEDLVLLLQTLADQIALTLNHARLQQQAQSIVEEGQSAFILSNRQAWLDAQRRGALPTYRYHRGRRGGGTDKLKNPEYEITLGGSTVEIPLSVRGQKIGSIDIAKGGDGQVWTENERELLESLADQISLALDSARLFDETQRYASFERMIGEVSTHVRESLNLENILMTAAEKVRQTMDLPEVTVRLASGVQHIEPIEPEEDQTSNG